jgi:hypothetical protein
MTGTSGCPSLIGIQSIRGIANIEKFNCMKLNDRVYDYVKTHQIKNVILANRWTYYTSSHSRPSEWNAVARFPDKPVTKETSTNDLKWAIQNTIKKYNDIGVKVIMVEDNPQQVFDPKDALRKAASKNDLAINKHSVSLQEHLKNQLLINKFIEAQGVQILNFDSVLCADMNCKLVKNGKFLYSDDDHLSVDGSLTIYPSLLNLLTSKRAVLNEAF